MNSQGAQERAQQKRPLRDFSHEELMMFIADLQDRARLATQKADMATGSVPLMIKILESANAPASTIAELEGRSVELKNQSAHEIFETIQLLIDGPKGRH